MTAGKEKLQKPAGWIFALLAVLALGIWHLGDVRAGIQVSNDRFLYGWYALLLLFGLAVLTGMGIFLIREEHPKLERVIPAVIMGLGVMYMAVLPPLSAPDEVSHFITAYQLSSHLMGKPARAEDERVFIRLQDTFIEDLSGVMEYGTEEGQNSPSAVVLGQKLEESTYREIHNRGFGSTGENEMVMSWQMPVRTTPLAYVPQALGIALARLLHLGGLGLLFLGRTCNLIFFSVMAWLTIKRLPFGKEVAAGVFLLPMTLHLASSLSYDVMIIALSAYFTAVCLDLACEASRVGICDVAALAAVMAVMGPCKMVYGVIAGLCLLIPVKKFGGWGKWGLSAAAVLGAFAAAMFIVNRSTVALYTQASESYVAWAEETGYTFSQLLHSPGLVLKMCYDTLAWQGEQLYSGMIGGALGNMDGVLNTPYPVILALTAALVLLALKKPGERMPIGWKGRLWIWFLCLVCLGALMFSMLLAWTPVTSKVIQGVQGRYLLPILPLFLLTLKNDKAVRTDWRDGGILFAMGAMDVYVVLRIFSLVCLRV